MNMNYEMEKIRNKFPCKFCGGPQHKSYRDGLNCCKHKKTKNIYDANPMSDFLFLCLDCGMKKNEAGDWCET